MFVLPTAQKAPRMVMMMIAFITLHLIESPYSSNGYGFDFFTFSYFAFRFRKEKYVRGKEQQVPDLNPPPSIYTLYTYTNTYMPRLNPFGFFGPSRCVVPTVKLTFEYPLCSECVCVTVCVQTVACIHSHALPPASNKEDTDNTTISPSVKNNPQRQATSALHKLAEAPHPP